LSPAQTLALPLSALALYEAQAQRIAKLLTEAQRGG